MFWQRNENRAGATDLKRIGFEYEYDSLWRMTQKSEEPFIHKGEFIMIMDLREDGRAYP